MTVKISRSRGKSLSAFDRMDPGNFAWPILRRRIFAHYRGSAASDGILGKEVAVGGNAMNRHEQRSGADFSRIIRDLTNLKLVGGQL
jgi:hypothetical protein